MNYNALVTQSMLTLSVGWLGNKELRRALAAHPLGAAACDHLEWCYAQLAGQYGRRLQLLKEMQRLTVLLQEHDIVHDRLARALFYFLMALAEATDDPDLAAFFRELRDMIFPNGLSMVQRSYMEEAGTVLEMELAVPVEAVRQLEEVQVGEHTLADLYLGWIAAGKALGQDLQARARLEASLSREGTAAEDASSVQMRSQWIRAVRLLVDVINTISLSDKAREQFFGPLETAIAESVQRRNAGSGTAEPDSEPGSDVESGSDAEPGGDMEAGSDAESAAPTG